MTHAGQKWISFPHFISSTSPSLIRNTLHLFSPPPPPRIRLESPARMRGPGQNHTRLPGSPLSGAKAERCAHGGHRRGTQTPRPRLQNPDQRPATRPARPTSAHFARHGKRRASRGEPSGWTESPAAELTAAPAVFFFLLLPPFPIFFYPVVRFSSTHFYPPQPRSRVGPERWSRSCCAPPRLFVSTWTRWTRISATMTGKEEEEAVTSPLAPALVTSSARRYGRLCVCVCVSVRCGAARLFPPGVDGFCNCYLHSLPIRSWTLPITLNGNWGGLNVHLPH